MGLIEAAVRQRALQQLGLAENVAELTTQRIPVHLVSGSGYFELLGLNSSSRLALPATGIFTA
jgi:hypothetical protein